MIKQDIVTRVSMKMGIPKVKADLAVDSGFSSSESGLTTGSGSNSEGSRLHHQAPQKRHRENPRTGREILSRQENRPF